jgi:pilus assembly protein Flp/PilA
MLRFFRKLRKDENGATAIEYGLIAGLISVVIIGVVISAGQQLNRVFAYIGTTLSSVPTSGPTAP